MLKQKLSKIIWDKDGTVSMRFFAFLMVCLGVSSFASTLGMVFSLIK